jgi:hypothetical protein
MKPFRSKTAKHTAAVTGMFREMAAIDARRALVLKITREIRTIENAIKDRRRRQRKLAAELKDLRARLKGQKHGLDIALQSNDSIATIKAEEQA